MRRCAAIGEVRDAVVHHDDTHTEKTRRRSLRACACAEKQKSKRNSVSKFPPLTQVQSNTSRSSKQHQFKAILILKVLSKIDVVSLRRALGLSDHDIFTTGIFHSITPRSPVNPIMLDVDHMNEDDIAADDMQWIYNLLAKRVN
jgi:hypothetical protein